MNIKGLAAVAVLSAAGFGLSGCLAAMATGAVVGATGAVVGTTVKVAAKGTGMVVGAMIPGGGKKDKDKKE